MNVKTNNKIKQGTRYFDLNGIIYVVIYFKSDVIKMMPLKKDATIKLFEIEEFKKQIKLLKFVNIPDLPINRINVSEHLLEFQFNLLGKTLGDTTHELDWKTVWRLNSIQHALFKSYAIRTLKKVFRCNSYKARETYEFFEKEFGLTINN
jgi:hypothetical protein